VATTHPRLSETDLVLLLTQAHPEHGILFATPRHLGEKNPAVDYFVELASDAEVTPFCLIQVKTTRAGYTQGGRLKLSVDTREMRRLATYAVPTYVVGIDERDHRGYVLSANGESTAGFSRMCTDHPLEPRTLAALHHEVEAYWRAARPAFESCLVDSLWRSNET
jgi:hypothetical protein